MPGLGLVSAPSLSVNGLPSSLRLPPSLPLTAVEVKVTSLKMLPFMDALASVPREYAPVRIDNSSVSLLASIWLAQISQDFCCGLGEALFENSSHDEVVEFEIPS